jgi:hypothetical protein
MVKRLTILILLLALTVFPMGCWDQVEVEQLAIIRAIAVDYLPGRKAPYLVTLSVQRPADVAGGEGGGGGKA